MQRKLWPFIHHFIAPYRWAGLLFVVLAMLSGLWGVFNSFLIKYMVDTLSNIQAKDSISAVFWPAVLFLINSQMHDLLWRGMGYINYKYQATIKNKVISETFKYIQRHTHQFFQDQLAGRLASQIFKLADNMERILHDISRHLIRVLVLLIASLVSLYWIHPTFCYGLLGWIFIFVFGSLRLSKRLVGLSAQHAAADSSMGGQLVDTISNADSVRLFVTYEHESSCMRSSLQEVKSTFQNKEWFSLRLHLFQGISITAMFAFMLYFLVIFRAQNKVSIGDYALILGLVTEVSYMLHWAMEQIDELNMAVGKCRESLKSLFAPLGIKDKAQSSDLVVTKGQIVLREVDFGYNNSHLIFKNLSVAIEPGQKVGLVGYSGGGKSTFVNLILRYYELKKGQILIDGQDISEVTQDSLRHRIAMIPQDPSLFHRTLWENVRYGKIDASDEEVMEAAGKAQAHDFIMSLPLQYDSLVGERGIKLSGGQRQRIAIARAMLKNAPILILDEATSQLDSITETGIQESLKILMKGKTTLVIAHRLSTLLHMDRILVFDQGRIVEDGPHEDLLARNGLYKSLWDAQVGGFLPDQKNQ